VASSLLTESRSGGTQACTFRCKTHSVDGLVTICCSIRFHRKNNKTCVYILIVLDCILKASLGRSWASPKDGPMAMLQRNLDNDRTRKVRVVYVVGWTEPQQCYRACSAAHELLAAWGRLHHGASSVWGAACTTEHCHKDCCQWVCPPEVVNWHAANIENRKPSTHVLKILYAYIYIYIHTYIHYIYIYIYIYVHCTPTKQQLSRDAHSNALRILHMLLGMKSAHRVSHWWDARLHLEF